MSSHTGSLLPLLHLTVGRSSRSCVEGGARGRSQAPEGEVPAAMFLCAPGRTEGQPAFEEARVSGGERLVSRSPSRCSVSG